MPTARALKICPDLILLPHNASYTEVSQKMFALCETITPLIERTSIDEGYLDLSPCGYTTTAQIETAIRKLQTRIWDELQIPVSFGIATNKLLAQVASKLRKPRALVVIPPGTEKQFLAPLPVGKLPGIGPKTEARLHALDINLVSDLLDQPPHTLEALFGSSTQSLLDSANGIDPSPVRTEHDAPKSHSSQTTFPQDISDPAQIERIAKRLLDTITPELRANKTLARTLTLRIRYPDFTQQSAAKTLPLPSNLETDFYPLILPLLRQIWKLKRPLRLIALTLSNLTPPNTTPAQLDLFNPTANNSAKRHHLAQTLDHLNKTSSTPKIIRASHLPNITSNRPNNSDKPPALPNK